MFIAAVMIGALLAWAGQRMLGVIFVCGGVGGMAGALITILLLPHRLRIIHNQQTSLRDSYRYLRDDADISVVTRMGQGTRQWSDYIKVLEDDSVFLLYHSDIMFETLPKSWFLDSARIVDFRAAASKAVAFRA